MNWSRGLFRLWLIVAGLWIAAWASFGWEGYSSPYLPQRVYLATTTDIDPNDEWWGFALVLTKSQANRFAKYGKSDPAAPDSKPAASTKPWERNWKAEAANVFNQFDEKPVPAPAAAGGDAREWEVVDLPKSAPTAAPQPVAAPLIPDERGGIYLVEDWSTQYELERTQSKIDFPDNVRLLVPPTQLVTPEFSAKFAKHYAERGAEIAKARAKTLREITTVALAPPLVLLLIGSVLLWALRGFRSH